MTTLTAGSTANFSLSGRQVLTLTADNNTTGTIKRTQYVESSSSKTDTLGPPATNRTYGPFGHETDIELTCTYGSFEYDVTGTSLVTAETDPVTGGSVFSVGDKRFIAHIAVSPSGDTSGATDTANIQAAIDAIYAAGGGSIHLLAGEYSLLSLSRNSDAYFSAIELKSGVSIVGEYRQSILTLVATESMNDYPGHMFFGNTVSNITLEGLTLDGNRTAFTAPSSDGVGGANARFVDSTDVEMRFCSSKSALFHGFFAVDGCRRISVHHSELSDCGYRGLHYHGADGTWNDIVGCIVSDNFVHDNGQLSATNSGLFFALDSAYFIQCNNNIVQNELGYGLDVGGTGPGSTVPAQYNMACGNIITACGNSGISLDEATNLLLVGNIVQGCGAAQNNPGVFMTNCYGVVLSSGNVSRNHAAGIRLGGSSSSNEAITITGVTLFDNNNDAILINSGGSTDVTIEACQILKTGVTANAVGSGIRCIDPPTARNVRLKIVNNTVSQSRGNPITVIDADDSLIMGNTLSDNWESTGPRGYGIQVKGNSDNVHVSHNIITNNNVTNTLGQVLVDAACTNISIIENQAESNAANKYQISAGATGRAYGNYGAGSWGGFLLGSAAL